MKLSYGALLMHLISDYNNLLFDEQHNPTLSLQAQKTRLKKKKRKHFKNDDTTYSSVEEELEDIKDDILHVWKLQIHLIDSEVKVDEDTIKLRGKYNCKYIIFTDPKTGEQSKMTFLHRVWFQRYILNPGMDAKWGEIVIEKCACRLRQLHLGYKLTHTARTYNLTCDHRRRIMSTTSGHPAQFNEKTLMMIERFLGDIHDGKADERCSFKL